MTIAAEPAGTIFLAVAPNGARKTKSDHPQVPVTPPELAVCAAACREAGAGMIHLHVRDAQGQHSLDVDAYKEAIAAVRGAVGNGLVVQVTSEAVGKYTPAEQMDMVRRLRPEAVSIAVRKLFAEAGREAEVSGFLAWMRGESIVVQFILYDAVDVEKYIDLRRRGIIDEDRHWVLFVLGRYSGGTSGFADLLPMLGVWSANQFITRGVAWAICAFGRREAECALASATLGGHVRIGFENNLLLPDGKTARDNAELIGNFADIAGRLGYRIGTADDLRGFIY